MTRFITGKELEEAVCNIIWGAKKELLIVSPYIKLDGYFIQLFEHHLNDSNLHLLVVFGKNEGNASKSLGKNDFDFFKKFPNVSIIYVPNLHAKYYGNESAGVISSINLYDFSFKNNIEFGVHSENGLLNQLTMSNDQQAWDKCKEIAAGGDPVFIKRPIFQKKLLSALTGGKNYTGSQILHDDTDSFYTPGAKLQKNHKKLSNFPDELDHGDFNNTGAMPTRAQVERDATGYCIRTGEPIQFNVNKPYCEPAYRSWAQYKNMDYKEKFCHKTGKPSGGKTSMRNPVLS